MRELVRGVGAAWRRRRELGPRGERCAARWLRRRGYRILHRNFALGHDEADLIALDPDGRTIVIVEVKTRRSSTPAPEEAVGPAKQRQLRRLALRLQAHGRYADRPMRCDAIAIVWPEGGRPEVRHYVAAF